MADTQSARSIAYTRAPFSTWLGIVCLFVLFGLIVLAVIGPSPRTSDYEETRAKKRMEKLKTLHEETQKELTTYAWVDKNKGVARIPIDRAMEVTVTDLAQKKPAPAGPIAAPSPQAVPAGASPTPTASQGAAVPPGTGARAKAASPPAGTAQPAQSTAPGRSPSGQGAANEGAKQPANAIPSEVQQANAPLSRARVYKKVESYDAAEKEIVDVIQKVTDPHLYEEAVSLWHEVEQAKQARVKRKAEAQLEEANRLISEGNAAEGATKANEVLGTSDDPEIWEKARAILAQNRPTPLSRARAYKKVESYDAAEKEIVDVIQKVTDPHLYEEAVSLWHEVEQAKQARVKRKAEAQLEEANRLISEGNAAEGATKANEVLGTSDDPEIWEKARAILARNRPTGFALIDVGIRDFFTTFRSIIGWVLALIEALVVLAFLYWMLRGGRRIRQRWLDKKKKSWWFGAIDDKTDGKVADFIITSFARWRAQQPIASAGLLRLGMLQLPILPSLEVAGPELDLSAALESLKLEVGTLSVGGVAKALAGVRNWFNALRPSITGAAFTRDSQIVVHLVKRSAKGDIAAVAAVANATAPEKAAESASFKVYYLISTGTTISDANLADKLRQGLDQLAQYISGHDPSQLQAAYETFRSVIGENPTYDEASLYEGVALDLLERHDEAINRFRYLAKNAGDSALREKAKYNEAVSRFRKYTPSELGLAIGELNGITGAKPEETDLASSPVKALAYAAKANAIAHKFLFWETILWGDQTTNLDQLLERKKKVKPQVEKWLEQVKAVTDLLEKVYIETKESELWDPLTRRQLRWAIQNARGNAYLNCAKEFYKAPQIDPAESKLRSELLGKALDSFQECEVLLPPGVETLTNLATTLLALANRDEARSYCERAITLNPNYEYAYYRLAQSWKDENRKDEAIKVLTRFSKAPRIPGFRQLYHQYYVEPKSA